MLRCSFLLLLSLAVNFSSLSSALKFIHNADVEVKLQDAAYPNILDYSAVFRYPTSTVFELNDFESHFLLVSSGLSQYYLWAQPGSSDVQINLATLKANSPDIVLVKRAEWLNGDISTNNAKLLEINRIDLYYAHAMDSLMSLARNNPKYRAEVNFSVIVWDSRSAKKLLNVGMEEFGDQYEKDLALYSPAYLAYWKLMYQLNYLYFDTNSFKGLNQYEAKATIEKDFNNPESRVMLLHHFFNEGIMRNTLEDNYRVLKGYFTGKEERYVQEVIQKQAMKELAYRQAPEFLFGVDIDNALKSFIARDSSGKKNVVVFWSFWDGDMVNEFNRLADLADLYSNHFNFIHICIDAYEAPAKTRSFVLQNRVEGFHLMPQSSTAFRKSVYRKDLKIRGLPFYMVLDAKGGVLESEGIPVRISQRFENKLNYFSKKK